MRSLLTAISLSLSGIVLLGGCGGRKLPVPSVVRPVTTPSASGGTLSPVSSAPEPSTHTESPLRQALLNLVGGDPELSRALDRVWASLAEKPLSAVVDEALAKDVQGLVANTSAEKQALLSVVATVVRSGEASQAAMLTALAALKLNDLKAFNELSESCASHADASCAAFVNAWIIGSEKAVVSTLSRSSRDWRGMSPEVVPALVSAGEEGVRRCRAASQGICGELLDSSTQLRSAAAALSLFRGWSKASLGAWSNFFLSLPDAISVESDEFQEAFLRGIAEGEDKMLVVASRVLRKVISQRGDAGFRSEFLAMARASQNLVVGARADAWASLVAERVQILGFGATIEDNVVSVEERTAPRLAWRSVSEAVKYSAWIEKDEMGAELCRQDNLASLSAVFSACGAFEEGASMTARVAAFDIFGVRVSVREMFAFRVAENSPPSVSVAIQGSAHVGQTLTCTESVTDPDGDSNSVSYSWEVSPTPSGVYSQLLTTTRTLLLAQQHAHQNIRCRVSVTEVGRAPVLAVSTAIEVANTAPSAPTVVSLGGGAFAAGTTLSCSASGSQDPDGDSVSYVFAWKRNDSAVNSASSQTLAGAFAKGDRMRCVAFSSDAELTSAAVESDEITIGNTLPGSPSDISISPSSFSKAQATISCQYTLAGDLDGDALSYEFLWKLGATPLGAWSSSASLPNTAFAKGDTVSCGVRARDDVGAGAEAWSAGVSVDNAPVTGTVTCDVPNVVGTVGSSFSVTCSGATDADGTSDFSYIRVAVSGSCPTVSSSGVLSGTLADTGTCLYKVHACDDENCTSYSSEYSIRPFVYSLSLSAPSLDSACLLSFPGVVTKSANVSASYVGDCGVSGATTTGTSIGISATLAASTAAGSYTASWGTTNGQIDGSGNGAVIAATSLSYAIQANAVGVPYAARPMTSSHEGMQVPSAGESSGCVGCSEANPGQISAGGSNVCAIGTDRRLRCWGGNTNGEMGTGNTVPSSLPIQETVLNTQVGSVALGGSHTCVVTAAGALKCFGSNGEGQLGDGTQTNRLNAVTPIASGVASVATGTSHTCAVTSAGALRCWGANYYGSLGNGNATRQLAPVNILASGVAAVSLGSQHSCLLTTSGGVKCFGSNFSGQVGDSTNSDRNVPTDVTGLASGVVAVVAGSSSMGGGGHSCALTTGGAVKCWGYNSNGQLGDGTSTSRNAPVSVSGLNSGIVAVAAGLEFTCAVTGLGAVKCWGNNYHGRLGIGSLADSKTPADVTGVSNAVAISAGDYFACALLADGTSKCWGYNANGQLGRGFSATSPNPATVPGVTVTATAGVSRLALGYNHTCVPAGVNVKCWGGNMYGQLGTGDTNSTFVPRTSGSLGANVVSVTAGDYHTCAAKADGTVACWGSGSDGRLGNGTTTQSSIPVSVTGIADSASVSAGANHSCSLSSSGVVKCWGQNWARQLGDGTTTQRNTPVAVSAANLSTVATAVAAAQEHTCAVKQGGGVACWGGNTYGQLGSGLHSDYVAVGAGGMSTCAVRSDGTVWCWGYNGYGNLGNGTTTNSTTPVQVSGVTGAVSVRVSSSPYACAVLNDGTVRCWGRSMAGDIGSNSTTEIEAVPLHVSGWGTTVSELAVGASAHTCVVLTDGAVQCIGDGSNGQLGFFDPTVPEPVVASLPSNPFAALVRACSLLSIVP